MNWWMIFCLGVTTYTVVFFEASYNGFRNLTGAQVDLLPGLVVYVALAHGSRPVAIFSLVAGLLYDSVSVNPLGISVIPLLLIGMGVCQKRELILKDQRYAQVVLGMAASAIALLGVVIVCGSSTASGLVEFMAMACCDLGGRDFDTGLV